MAGFNTAVTGLKSASSMLDVAGNNIANSSTVGYKSSRTEFSDIFATSVVGAGSSNQPGSGVTVSDISQDFSAGTIEFTNNNLDLAINGSGFFQLNDGQGGITYTRAGSFELDKDGYIVSKTGKFLQGFEVDSDGRTGTVVVDLAVSQKESLPKVTENIDLSFNIDATQDAETLNRVFDKTDPGSYSYSTTVEIVNSLGESDAVRFYMVEQAAVRETYQFTISDATAVLDTDTFLFSGIQVAVSDVLPGGDLYDPSSTLYASLQNADPRIDLSTLVVTDTRGTNGEIKLAFEFFAQDTNKGDMRMVGEGGISVDLDPSFPGERPANEVRSITVADPTISGAASFSVAIGNYQATIDGPFGTQDLMGLAIENLEPKIIDANPDIESVIYETSGPQAGNIVITYKAEVGQIDPPIQYNGTAFGATSLTNATLVDVGDNSYLGSYLMYAFLDDGGEVQPSLDIGKETDPGEPQGTEPGPILIKFDATSGTLSEVNGLRVRGIAPPITITGADTAANPEDPSTIALDITGSSQFASESIVKAIAQDGYPKGDLIGVTFEENGAMVASFSNGQRQDLGRVGIASFENQSGLRSAGNTEWIATLSSGVAVLNTPGAGLNGTLRSAALESSNVDLSAELVKLIEAQRNFQANSKTLETQNTVTQAILQI